MDDALLKTIWDWAWPSLSLVGWTISVVWSLRRFFPKFANLISEELQERGGQGLDRDDDAGVDTALIARLQRMAGTGLIISGIYVWFYLAPMPEAVKQFMSDKVQPWFWYSLGLVAWIIGGVYFTRRAIAFVAERAARTNAAIDDALAEAIRRPLYIMLFVIGVNLWAAFVPLHEDAYSTLLLGNKGATVLIIVVFLKEFLVIEYCYTAQFFSV